MNNLGSQRVPLCLWPELEPRLACETVVAGRVGAHLDAAQRELEGGSMVEGESVNEGEVEHWVGRA